jgi:hypothetical protein
MGTICNYVVRYNSDPRLVTDNHRSDIIYLLDVDERGFNDLNEAILFLQECTDAITTVEDLIPELKTMTRKIKYILPEKNITVKHVLVGNMDIHFNEHAGSWEFM